MSTTLFKAPATTLQRLASLITERNAIEEKVSLVIQVVFAGTEFEGKALEIKKIDNEGIHIQLAEGGDPSSGPTLIKEPNS